MRYLASVSYDGSKFWGFQRLNEKRSVQKELERALKKINKKEVIVKGAGRTDRGVHAYDQKIHFDLDININEDGLLKALNSVIDEYIHINYVKEVNDNFHARFDVKKKVYRYIINMGEYDAIKNDYLYNYCYDLDINLMKKASKSLLGLNSYEAFTSGERENYNSAIYKINFKKKNNILEITFVGKNFYRYMVRNMVGALMLVGSKKVDTNYINDLMNNKITLKHMTVPANGLYLMKVEYQSM